MLGSMGCGDGFGAGFGAVASRVKVRFYRLEVQGFRFFFDFRVLQCRVWDLGFWDF